MGWIYRITSPSWQEYHGRTIHDNPLIRWRQHQDPKSGCTYVRRAIAKYGVENMKFEPLYEISYKTHGYRWREFLCFWEKYEIEEADSIVPNGYNLQTGGKHHQTSEETKQKISATRKGQKASEVTKLKMKKTPEQKEFLRILRLGTRLKEETKLKISAWGKGRPKSDEHKAKIKDASKNKVLTEEHKLNIRDSNVMRKSKPVSQFTKDGVLVKTYESAKAAYREVGIHYSGISKCARGHIKHKTAGGFVWKFT